jgi:hypothetical protein
MEITKQQQLTNRKAILAIEDALMNVDDKIVGDSEVCPLKHSFSDGIYVREIRIPKGMVLTGKIHRHDHPNFLMSGKVVVITEGGGKEVLEGPMAMISAAGTKRALHSLTDLVWITVHHNPTNTQDLAEIEKMVIADSFEEYEKHKQLRSLEKEYEELLKRKPMNKLISYIKKLLR